MPPEEYEKSELYATSPDGSQEKLEPVKGQDGTITAEELKNVIEVLEKIGGNTWKINK